MIMSETADTLRRAANLVKLWGNTKLSSGKTLGEILTIQRFSFWEVTAVEIAFYKLPKVLTPGATTPSLTQRFRPYFGRGKQIVRDFLNIKRTSQECAIWPIEPVVLFLGFNTVMYRDVIRPVINHLSKYKSLKTITLHDGWYNPTMDIASSDGIHCIWQHWDRGVVEDLRSLRYGLKEVMAELRTLRALPQIIQDNGQMLWPLMQDTFNWFFQQRLPQLLSYAAIARHILCKHRPVLVVSPDGADPHTRMYYLLCQLYNIPSLEIQFGLAGPDSVEYQFFLASRIAAFGDDARKFMIAYGVPAEKISVTGSPRQDSLVRDSSAEITQTRIRLGMPEGKAMLLLAATYDNPGYPKVRELGMLMIKAIFQVVDQMDGVCLVVKPHPVVLKQPHYLRQLADKRRNILFADPKGNIQELIKACDAFVAMGSTTVLDALVLNKLTITPAFPGWSGNDQFVEIGATLTPRSAEEIARSLQIVVDGSKEKVLAELEPARQRFLYEWIYKADGQAASRVEELVLQMAKIGVENA